MSELRNRMIQDLKLAKLEGATAEVYLRAVRQLAAYYMVPPAKISERAVQDHILYVRDELGVAKGTFEPLFYGLKFFYVNTLGYDWPLFTKKSPQATSEAAAGRPWRRRLSPPDRHDQKTDLSRLLHADLCLWHANRRDGHAARHGGRSETDGPPRDPHSSKRETSAASTKSFDRTRFDTALPRTCLSKAWTYESSRSCWDILAYDPRRFTPI